MVSRLHRVLLRDLWHLRGQVIAVGLVAACGIAAFVTMMSTYRSLVSARAAYYADYHFADVFVHLKRAPNALGDELRQVPGIAVLQTRVLEDVTLSVPGLAEPASGRLISLSDTRRPMLNDLALRQGRYPARDGVDEILASETFARANALDVGSRVGAIINGRWRLLTIVGLALSPEYVYEVGPSMVFPDNRRFGILWMNAEALAAAYDMKNAFNDVAVSLTHGASSQDVMDRLDLLLVPYGGLNAYGRLDQTSNRFLSDELGEIEVNATYIPAIFLVVSAFLIYTLLSRLVSIQRGQIGLLKAFGYSNARVGLHFLEFALCVVGIGLTLGVGMGTYLGGLLIGVYRQYFHFPFLQFELPAEVLLWAGGIALVSAALGSLTAVSRAVQLAPAEAMRPEPPKSFRAGLLEASGLVSWIGSSGRVIMRNITRRPARAILSVAGIAAAVATVAVGRFTFDAVNHLMAVHFDWTQREDASVMLLEAGSSSALLEMQRLPGVMRAEGFRLVPVRISVGHRRKQSAILGVSADAELRQLVDARRQRIPMPPEGIVMTRKLAELLGAHAGDELLIEQLDGRKLVFREPLVALSDEPLGIGAYMDAQALARVLHEAGEVSGASMQLDRLRAPAFYEALKRTPAVGAVAIREAMLQTIRDTMNRSFVLMTLVMTGFATVLVVGVVYNSARIALSERGNELASLRVLGFTKGEVIALLLGEQTVLTIAAIPLGFLLGAAVESVLVPVFNRELFRLPFVLSARTLAVSALVTLAAAAFSAALVARRTARLELIAVLKSRE